LSDSAITFTIVALVVVLFVWDRLPVVLVALGTALALYATGVLDLGQALAGLGDPTVIFIASLFVVSAGLDATGVTAWAGQLLSARAGKSRARLLLLIMLLVALLAALININGAVPALLPVVVVMAVRAGQPPSQLLMPLAFAASAGSLLALTGTPVNVLISKAAVDAGVGGFGYFEFALAGVPLLLGTIAIVILFGQRLLPNRGGRMMPADLSKHARTLIEHYRLADGLFQLRVRPGSPWVGAPRTAIDLTHYPGLAQVSIRTGEGGPLGRPILAEGDILVVRGEAETASRLAADKVLGFRSEDGGDDVADTLFNRASGLAEVVIPPRSALIGQTVFPGMVTPSGDLIILAVQRRGEDQGLKETVLAAGDTLLLQGTWKALDTHLDDPDVLVVDSPELVRRQAVPLGPGAKQAVVVLLGLVLLLATGLTPAVVAGLLAACAMVLLRVLTVEQAYRSINWTTVILIGAMTPLSTAMSQSGAADRMADVLVGMVGDSGPYALLAGLFVLTAILGQLISNVATALIIIPIAVTAATDLGVSARPVLMSVCVASAAAFLTPVATPVNLIVMGPGGYRFGDYWKLGLPLLLWFFVVAVFLVPLIWSFDSLERPASTSGRGHKPDAQARSVLRTPSPRLRVGLVPPSFRLPVSGRGVLLTLSPFFEEFAAWNNE
jgi:di/tricarboxylate transporter